MSRQPRDIRVPLNKTPSGEQITGLSDSSSRALLGKLIVVQLAKKKKNYSLSRNMSVHYRVQGISSLLHILSQINSIHSSLSVTVRSVLLLTWSMLWHIQLRHCATIRKVAGSVPDRAIGIFN